MRYKIVLSYSGKEFFGWQIQPEAISVQETIEKALRTLLGSPTALVGAGRTDTGVSAVGYVAHFDSPSEINAEWLRYKLNAILPPSIAIEQLCSVAPDFHARFGAKSRSYTYFLHRCKDPLAVGSSYFYGYPSLDFNLMNQAAQLLIGTHDFSCFQKKGSDNKTTICTVSQAEWRNYTPAHVAIRSGSLELGGCAGEGLLEQGGSLAKKAEQGCQGAKEAGQGYQGQNGDYWYFSITADRFLRNMVRAVVGTLLEVGRGKRSLENFASLLNGGARTMSGESAPAHALFFSGVEY